MSRRYTFRLNEEDTDLMHLLEGIPSSKRSEVIREMLRYAYLKKMEEKRGGDSLSRLEKKVENLIERFDRLEEKLAYGMTGHSEQNDVIGQNTLRKNAQSLLSAFGAFDSRD